MIDTENASLPSISVSLNVGSVNVSEVTAGLENVRTLPARVIPLPGRAAIASSMSCRKLSVKSAPSVAPAPNASVIDTVLPSASVAPV